MWIWHCVSQEIAYAQTSWTRRKPGPNIPLNLPIIQEFYSLISTPLFKRKSPIILKKKADKNADET